MISSPEIEDQTGRAFLPEAGLPAAELKGSVFTLTVVRIQSPELDAVEKQLKESLAQGPRFFENAPVVVDLEPLKSKDKRPDLFKLITLLRTLRLIPVGVRNACPEQRVEAVKEGIAIMQGGVNQDLPLGARIDNNAVKVENEPKKQIQRGQTTKVVRKTVRSGQQVYAAGGDLIVLAPVNAGAEIVADGHIHVYAPLRGRALAGVMGDAQARIFCQCMEAELVAVAGQYLIYEEELPHALHRKPVQVYLEEEQLKVVPLVASEH
ncbi:MAG: septum site-determining protein MinC [Gammaproteobacteria bacterium]